VQSGPNSCSARGNFVCENVQPDVVRARFIARMFL
jgi:hypothetical protein